MRGTNVRTLIFAALVCGLTLLTAIPASARVWTRQSDGKKLEATFVRMEGDNLVLKIAGGREVTVPKAMFIKADIDAAESFGPLGDNTEAKTSAAAIDQLLAKGLVRQDPPIKSFNEPLRDDLFVRRAYVDILGRIPTRAEFAAFAESPRADKRGLLIDQLLLEPGRAHHMFNYFADMYRLHATADFPNGIRFEPYINWWKESLANNVHYDDMVMQMITAQGNLGHNPAAGFLLRDAGMEFDAFSNFGQVMLGIDISCAQCHDHPFDEWTMDDFYKMAAFFGQTQRTLARYQKDEGMGTVAAAMPRAPEGWVEKMDQYATSMGIDLSDPMNSRQYRYYVNFLGWNIADDDERVSPVPMNVEDIGGEVYKPSVLVGKAAKMSGKTRREALAEWLTAPDNPRFAMVIANRMWSMAFGRGLVEPANDFPSEDWEKMCAQPEVLKFLSREMIRVDYDLREFQRIIFNTQAYQTLATFEEPSQARPYAFQGPVLRRMRAEQAWDSLMVLAHGADIDKVKGRDGSYIRSYLNVDFEKDSLESVWEKYQAFVSQRGSGAGAAMVAEPGMLTPTMAEIPKLYNMELVRAAEMEQPAPGASLLDTFGQSDRMVTDEHIFDGSVPQVLALMNGVVTDYLTGSNSKVVTDLESLDAPEDKVRAIYHTMLSRFPEDEEQAMGVEILEEYGDDGIRDLAWALMNSPEFLFIQ